MTPEQAGEVFSRTKPKLAVYSHIVLPTSTEQDLLPSTRKTYSGPLKLGEDLMVITVGEKEGSSAWPLFTVAIVLSRRAAVEEPSNGVERAWATVGDLASLSARAAHAER